MSAARDSVARQSHDSGETSHKTSVIPLRPGDGAPPPPAPLPPEERRVEALRLSRDEGLSLREIGTRLGIGKDAVARDIKAAKQAEQEAAASEHADNETSRDRGETPPDTPGDTDETTQTPDGDDRDRLVLVLDEPLRRALAVLRAAMRAPDTMRQNEATARAAIRAMADTVLEPHGGRP